MNTAGEKDHAGDCQNGKQERLAVQQLADHPEQRCSGGAEDANHWEKEHGVAQILLCPVQALYRNGAVHRERNEKRFKP